VVPAGADGLRDAVAAFRDWAHNLVPGLTHLRPGIGRTFGMLDQLIVSAVLMLLALRVLSRSAVLQGAYADELSGKTSKRGMAGLLCQFFTLMLLIGVLASAQQAIVPGRTGMADQARFFMGSDSIVRQIALASEQEVVQRSQLLIAAWLIASFMVLSALSLGAMAVIGRRGTSGLIARGFNDGVFGIAAVVLLLRGGVPHAPFGVIEQCTVLALANSVVGFAISATLFEKPDARTTRGFGFSALGVIMLVIVVLLFTCTGQAP